MVNSRILGLAASFDPDHSLDPSPGDDTDPRNEVFLTAYGPAFGDPDNGFISYMAGHSLSKSSGSVSCTSTSSPSESPSPSVSETSGSVA